MVLGTLTTRRLWLRALLVLGERDALAASKVLAESDAEAASASEFASKVASTSAQNAVGRVHGLLKACRPAAGGFYAPVLVASDASLAPQLHRDRCTQISVER
jgi:hypothetical protein